MSDTSLATTPGAQAAPPNPFAQFDQATAWGSGSNPFAQFDATPAKGSGVAANAAAGFNETAANVAGAPVDAVTWLLNKIPGVDIKNPILGSDFLKHNVLGAIGADPDKVVAANTAEQLARGFGAGAGMAVAPEALPGKLTAAAGDAASKIPFVGNTVQQIGTALAGGSSVGQTAAGTAGKLATTALAGGSSGVGGQIASDVAPDPLKPAAGLVGGVLGGLPALAPEAARALLLTKSAQESAAGMHAVRIAGGVPEAQTALNNLRAAVPGQGGVPSAPNAAEAAYNFGLYKEQQALANPSGLTPAGAKVVQNQQTSQAARTGTLTGLTGPSDAAGTLTAGLQAKAAADAAAASGTTATETSAALAQQPSPPATPEARGTQISDAVVQQQGALKADEGTKWDAVRALNLPDATGNDFRGAVSSIYSGLGPDTSKWKSLSSGEQDLYNTALVDTGKSDFDSTSPTVSVSNLDFYRKQVGDALSAAKTAQNTLAVGRLKQLYGNVTNLITAQGAGTAGAADVISAAKDSTTARMNFEDQPFAKAALDTQGRTGQLAANARSSLPDEIFTSGATGAELAGTVRTNLGDQTALPLLRDSAAAKLLAMPGAVRASDGLLDPAVLQRFTSSGGGGFGNALRGAGLDGEFSTLAKTNAAVIQAADARNEAAAAVKETLTGQLLNTTDPSEAVRQVSSALGKANAPSLIGNLARSATAAGPDTAAALKYTVGQAIASKFVDPTTNELKSGGFVKFIQDPAVLASLRIAGFSPDDISGMTQIAAEYERTAALKAGAAATAIPPREAGILQTAVQHGPQATTALGIGAAIGGSIAGHFGFPENIGDIVGAATAGFGSPAVIHALQLPGKRAADSILAQAFSDPALMTTILQAGKARLDSAATARLQMLYARRTLLPGLAGASGPSLPPPVPPASLAAPSP